MSGPVNSSWPNQTGHTRCSPRGRIPTHAPSTRKIRLFSALHDNWIAGYFENESSGPENEVSESDNCECLSRETVASPQRSNLTITSIFQRRETLAAKVPAKVETDIWSARNLVDFLHVLLMLESDGQLRVPDATGILITRAPSIHFKIEDRVCLEKRIPARHSSALSRFVNRSGVERTPLCLSDSTVGMWLDEDSVFTRK